MRAEGRGPRAEESPRASSPSAEEPSWPRLITAVRDRTRAIARTVRTIIGAPDYERYVEHVRLCHPDRAPLTRDEFARERMEDRYSRPGTRCC